MTYDQDGYKVMTIPYSELNIQTSESVRRNSLRTISYIAGSKTGFSRGRYGAIAWNNITLSTIGFHSVFHILHSPPPFFFKLRLSF